MAHIRTYQDLLKSNPTKPEEQLIAHAKAGTFCELGDGSCPPDGATDPARKIRAGILRYLILGGCKDCIVDDIGVWVSGAHVTETLDLDFTTARGAVRLINTRFEKRLDMEQTSCKLLRLDGSNMKGLRGQAIATSGSVSLRDVTSLASIEFNSSRIGGQLVCAGAQLLADKSYALNLQGAEIIGGVFLHPRSEEEQESITTPFSARGGITLTGATIGSLLAESVTLEAYNGNDALRATNVVINGNAKFSRIIATGEVRLTGARITGTLNCENATFENAHGHAFNGQRMQIEQSFVWRKVTNPTGQVSLNGAHVTELDDDPENWPTEPDNLLLDGFTYHRIRGKVSTSRARDAWLKNGSIYKGQFFPQPYTQYAKFLYDTGHDAQSRKVLLIRERIVRRYERKEFAPLLRAWRYFWDGLQLVVVGHGHAPFWSIGWLALLIALATIPAHKAWEEGSFAPNASPILISQGWQQLQGSEQNPAKVWAGDLQPVGWAAEKPDTDWRNNAPGRDWETFNRYAYAADTVIPLINFGQTDAWAPSTTRGPWGETLWWARWVFTVIGWIVTALGAAAITGIIRRE